MYTRDDDEKDRYYVKFEMRHDSQLVTHVMKGHGYPWHEVLEQFIYFLRGCGYHIPEGEYVPVDVPTPDEV